MSLPAGEDRRPVVGPRREPGAGLRAVFGQARHSWLRLRSMRPISLTPRRARSGPRGAASVARDRRRRATVAAALAGFGAMAPSGASVSAGHPAAVPAAPGPWDWPTYGHDAQHTFHGRTTLTKTSVRTLRQAWFFPTGDAVTATPTVVGDTVYAGSWDDYFYALT